jgi:chromate transporter
MDSPTPAPRVRIRDLVLYYLRLGTVGFGGPVALCGQMERELVQERRWLTKDEMREAIAVCQSLPGPLAIQVGIFVSYLRGGFWGAWAGGWGFILPNFVIVSALGALYVHFGGLSLVTAIFYGVSPAVIALILHSCYRLAKLGMEDWLQWVIVAVCFAVTVAVQTEVALLFVGAGIVGVLYYGTLFRARAASSSLPLLAVWPVSTSVAPSAQASILSKLLLFFLKAGSLTFGSGLVIVPFLEKGLVQHTGWLDERQFLVAVAMGMLSPGPVVITATFVGYVVAGFWGGRHLHGRHLPPLVPVGADRGPDPPAIPHQLERAGVRQGGVCGRHRDHPRGVRASGTDCHRRLAHGAGGLGELDRAVPLEGQQSPAGRGYRDYRVDCLSPAAARMGVREVGPVPQMKEDM